MTKTLEKTPNELQQKCINSIEGKYLVLAGPGTGKTFTIINRIKNMIKNKNVNAEEILCLTFTDAAANEMRSRLNAELEEVSAGVNIYTYHGFCCEVIEEFRDEFELPSNFRIVTDSISRTFIKECIDEINPKAFRTEKNDPYFYIDTIKNSINEIKKYRLTKESYFYNIEHNRDWLPELESKKAELAEKIKQGKTRTATIEGEIVSLEKKIEKVKELWQFYEKYQEKMTQNHYLDFNDMISFVLDKFENDPLFLSTIANKYKYVLVDEYQDTNMSQNSIVFHLSKALETQNIFVVGDDDQIIYSFQGAKLDTIENFLREFPDTKVICLRENMRSTQSILDVSRLVAMQDSKRLENNSDFKQYNISKKLTAKNEDIIAKDKPVRFVEYVDEMQEYNSIVDEIEALINSPACPKDKEGNPKLSEIAILASTNAQLDTFVELFNARNIQCELKNGISIFSNHAVNVLISYMQMLTNPDKYSHKVFQILLSQPFNVSAKDYRLITENCSKFPTPLDCIRSFKDEDFEEGSKLKIFLQTYDYLSAYKTSENIKNTLLEIGSKTSIFDYYMNFEINRTENISALKKLIEEASAYSEIYKTSLLEEFVNHLEILQNDEIDILTDKAPVTFNAVQLSTYHSAKGKEFEYVYMPALISANWESSRTPSINIPLNPSEYKNKEELQELKLSDKIKVLYVGMTRAKHALTLSYALTKNGKPKKLSAFISNIKNSLNQIKAPEYDEASFWKETAKTLTKRDYDYKRDFAEMIKSKLKDKSYSPSAINTYLKCPRQYLYSKILKLDGRDGNPDNASYGTAVHSACEFAVKYALKNKEYPSKEDFIESFKNELSNQKVSDYKNRVNLEGRGEKALDEFYNQIITYPIKNLVNSEQEISYTSGDYSFYGIVDRVDKNEDGTYSIYDYKTGKAKNSKQVCPEGEYEDYYNQMAIYKYMFENLTGNKVSNTVFIFPEDFTKNLTVNYTEEECKEVVEKFKNAIDKINDIEFEPTCDKNVCQYCACTDFCKANVL